MQNFFEPKNQHLHLYGCIILLEVQKETDMETSELSLNKQIIAGREVDEQINE
jgi:hypothetical protein